MFASELVLRLLDFDTRRSSVQVAVDSKGRKVS